MATRINPAGGNGTPTPAEIRDAFISTMRNPALRPPLIREQGSPFYPIPSKEETSVNQPYPGSYTSPPAGHGPAQRPGADSALVPLAPVPSQPLPPSACAVTSLDCGDAISPPSACYTTGAIWTKGATAAAVEGLSCDVESPCNIEALCRGASSADRLIPAHPMTGSAQELENSDFRGITTRNVSRVRSIVEMMPEFRRVPQQAQGASVVLAGVLTYFVYIAPPAATSLVADPATGIVRTNEGWGGIFVELSGPYLTSQSDIVTITTATIHLFDVLFAGSLTNQVPISKFGMDPLPRTITVKTRPMPQGGLLARIYLLNAVRQVVPTAATQASVTPVVKLGEHGFGVLDDAAVVGVAPIVVTITGLPAGMTVRAQKIGAETTPLATLTGLIESPILQA